MIRLFRNDLREVTPVRTAVTDGIQDKQTLSFGTKPDVCSPFEGRSALPLIERHGAAAFEAHPTKADHQVIADTFAAAIRRR